MRSIEDILNSEAIALRNRESELARQIERLELERQDQVRYLWRQYVKELTGALYLHADKANPLDPVWGLHVSSLALWIGEQPDDTVDVIRAVVDDRMKLSSTIRASLVKQIMVALWLAVDRLDVLHPEFRKHVEELSVYAVPYAEETVKQVLDLFYDALVNG